MSHDFSIHRMRYAETATGSTKLVGWYWQFMAHDANFCSSVSCPARSLL